MGSITISDEQLVEKIKELGGQLAIKDLAMEAYAKRAGELEEQLEAQYEKHPEDRPNPVPAPPQPLNREERRRQRKASV